MRVLIAGGGISGLSLAYALAGQKDIKIVVLEAEERAGGKIRTERAGGFLCEWGVNGFLDNRPKTLEMASALGLRPLRSSDSARKRFLFLEGKLRRLPESPGAFLRSGVLSAAGKLRLACEPFIPPFEGDETLARFAERRLGRQAYENLIDPMASGIYAGDPEQMSVESCFPKIKAIERKYGSLIKGMIKLGREAKKAGRGPVGAGPGGTLTSFLGGMDEIVTALKSALGDRVRLQSRMVSVERLQRGYKAHLSNGNVVETDVVVLACPAYEAASILKDLDKGLSARIEEIKYPALSVVSIGFGKRKVASDINSFGFLIPFKEGRRMLGTLYDSSIFPKRAPDGHVLFRVMVGGARASRLAMQDEGKLLAMAMGELKGILKVSGEPDFFRVFRHEKAIPQYDMGHPGRLRHVDEALARYPGLFITGNAMRGIGLNDCIENSFVMADKIKGLKEAAA